MAAERDYMKELDMAMSYSSSPPKRVLVIEPTPNVSSLIALAAIGGGGFNPRGSFESTRAVGASVLPSAPPPKNRPCPCGSGRKYKRCCSPHRRGVIDGR